MSNPEANPNRNPKIGYAQAISYVESMLHMALLTLTRPGALNKLEKKYVINLIQDAINEIKKAG